MKRLILITFAYSLFIVNAVHANSKDFETRTATVKVNVSENDLINIRAKNTDLVVETWDKNEVEVTATVRFDGKMTDKMIAFLDNFQKYVEENIGLSGGELLIDTNLDEPNKIQIGGKQVGIVIGFSEDEFKLDYKVKAPRQNRFEIDNSYKDVRLMGDFENLKLTQYSGELTAGSIKRAELNLKYGTSTFESLGVVDMQLYEQELDAKSIDRLEIETKYSDIEVARIGRMDANSYETDYVFGNAENISGKFKYGEMEIEQKLGQAELDFYETDLEAFEAGSIEFNTSKYAKLKFNQVNDLSFSQSYEDELTIGKLGSFRSEDSKYGKHSIQSLSGSFRLKAYEDDVEIEKVAGSTDKIDIEGKYINSTFGISDQSFSLATHIKYGKVDYEEDKVYLRKYIKEGDVLQVEIHSKNLKENAIQVSLEGYEIDVKID